MILSPPVRPSHGLALRSSPNELNHLLKGNMIGLAKRRKASRERGLADKPEEENCKTRMAEREVSARSRALINQVTIKLLAGSSTPIAPFSSPHRPRRILFSVFVFPTRVFHSQQDGIVNLFIDTELPGTVIRIDPRQLGVESECE